MVFSGSIGIYDWGLLLFGNRALHVCYGFLVYSLFFMNIITSFVLVRPSVGSGMTTASPPQQARQAYQ